MWDQVFRRNVFLAVLGLIFYVITISITEFHDKLKINLEKYPCHCQK